MSTIELSLVRRTCRIVREPYEDDAPDVTRSHDHDLIGTVARAVQDPTWATPIVLDRCKIRTIATHLGNRGAVPSRKPCEVQFELGSRD